MSLVSLHSLFLLLLSYDFSSDLVVRVLFDGFGRIIMPRRKTVVVFKLEW